MKISKKIYLSLMFVCSLLPSLAHADKMLDKVEVIQTQTEAEVHIEFLTQVRYLRHFPNNKEASRVQIYLDFPQLTALPKEREFLTSGANELVPSFTVNYPDQKNNSIGVRFKKPIKFKVTPDNSGRGIVIHVPLDKSVAHLAPVVTVPKDVTPSLAVSGDTVSRPDGVSDNEYAGKLVADSKVAIGQGDYPKAVLLLNTALNQPPNGYTQEAQELIGVSREKSGDLAKAKAEYELYLKLYPESEGAARVRKNIANIDATLKVSAAPVAKGKKVFSEIHETTVYGSWDQYYYDAHSHQYDPVPSKTKNMNTHDQSQLVSAIDLTARSRQNQYDSKIVFRNTQIMDFLAPVGQSLHRNKDRTTAAYIEIQNKEVDYLVRVGRQNGNSGGVLGRFDGGLFRYGITPQLRVNLVAGTLDETHVNYHRDFYGINFDIGPVFEHWSGNAFLIEQKVDSITDRRAVGGEVRYNNQGRSVYSLIDYDTIFKQVNIAMVQGNLHTEGGTDYNVLLDHRKSPILTMSNAITAQFFSDRQIANPGAILPRSVAQALNSGVSEPLLQQIADQNTLSTDSFLLGATRQFTPQWQIGADFQANRTSGSPGAGQAAIDLIQKEAIANGILLTQLDLDNLQRTIGSSGTTYTYHAQAVGTDTIFKNDTSVISVSYVSGPSSQVESFVYSNIMMPRDKWRLDSTLKLVRIASDPSVIQYVVSPTFRASYRLREKATIEAEINLEVVNINDPLNGHSRSFRDSSFIGYRLDI